MFMTEGNGAGGGAQGAGDTGAQGAGTGAANAQNGNSGSTNQGLDTSQLVSRSDFEALTKKLDGVLSDNAKYRSRLRALVTGEDEEEENGKSGKADKAAAKVDNLTRQLRNDRFEAQITTAAVKAGAAHPEQVVAMLKIDDVADELGNVKDAEKAITELKTKYPNLFGTASQGFGSVNGGEGNGSNRKRTAADVNAEIRAFRRGRELSPR